MNTKLESVKPYVKFFLQHATGQPISDKSVNEICKGNAIVSVNNVGEGYALMSEIRFMKRTDVDKLVGDVQTAQVA